jgi:cholinesterase
VSDAVGCGGSSIAADKTLECMRSKPYTEILAGLKNSNLTAMGSFFPTADEKIVFRDYEKRRAEGNFIKVPYLVGNTDDEPGISYAIARPAPKAPVVKRQATPAIQSKDGCGPDVAATARVKAGLPAWRYVSAMVFPNSDVGK